MTSLVCTYVNWGTYLPNEIQVDVTFVFGLIQIISALRQHLECHQRRHLTLNFCRWSDFLIHDHIKNGQHSIQIKHFWAQKLRGFLMGLNLSFRFFYHSSSFASHEKSLIRANGIVRRKKRCQEQKFWEKWQFHIESFGFGLLLHHGGWFLVMDVTK